MEELLLINPHKRGARRRKARTPAQRRATARMLAANRSRRAPVAKRRRARRHNPAPVVYAANPAPRRHRRRAAPLAALHRTQRRYRRNPAPRMAGVMGMAKNAFQGAIGATVVNTVINFVPLPAVMKTGRMMYVSQGLLAVLLGVFGRKVMPGNMAAKMAEGSLTVTMHSAIKDVVGGMVPGMNLGYFPGGYVSGGIPGVSSAPAPAALAEYLNQPSMAGLGEVSEYVHY